jgi:hypothetical protein
VTPQRGPAQHHHPPNMRMLCDYSRIRGGCVVGNSRPAPRFRLRKGLPSCGSPRPKAFTSPSQMDLRALRSLTLPRLCAIMALCALLDCPSHNLRIVEHVALRRAGSTARPTDLSRLDVAFRSNSGQSLSPEFLVLKEGARTGTAAGPARRPSSATAILDRACYTSERMATNQARSVTCGSSCPIQ